MRFKKDKRSSRERRLLWTLVALILATWAVLTPVLFAYRTWPFDSDETVHAMNGLRLAVDLRGAQIGDLASHFYFHRWYPPLLSVYLMPFLAFLGPSYWAARCPLLLLFPLNVALFYRVGRLLWRRWEAGLVAALLGATSPLLWMLALLCMEESLALTGLLLVVAGFARATRGKLAWFWPGLALVLVFLARISSGAFAGVALLVVCWTRRGTLTEKTRVTGQLLGPLAVTAFVWWLHPYKLGGLQDYFFASAPRQSAITWSLLTHYWGQLLSTHTVGWGIGLLVVFSILLSLPRWREPVVRLLLILFVITWGALVLKRQLAPRLFFAALPPAFLLTASQAAMVCERIRWPASKRAPWFRRTLFAALALYLLVAVAIRALVFPFLMEVAYETDRRSEQARAWILQQAPGEKLFLVNGWDQFSALALRWYLANQRWPHWQEGRVSGVELQDPAKSPQAVADFQAAMLASPKASIVHLGNTPVPEAGAWWAYRASLAGCWDGEWETEQAFQIGIWDKRLEEEILAHPTRFMRKKDQEATRQSFWYLLRFEVHIATCSLSG
jgi:hypothetical protein